MPDVERTKVLNEKWVIIAGIISLPLVNLAFVSDKVITWLLTIFALVVLGLASTWLTLRPAAASIAYSNTIWRVVGAAVSLPLALFVFATMSAGSTQQSAQVFENFVTDMGLSEELEELSDQEVEGLETSINMISELISGPTLDAPLIAAKILWIIALITVLGLAVVSIMDLVKTSTQSRETSTS